MTAIAATSTRRRTTALVTAALLNLLAGCSIPAHPNPTPQRAQPDPLSAAAGVPVLLRSGNWVATATMTDDTPAARQLAAMLPLTVPMKDVWAQAKSGLLPDTLTGEGATPVHDPVPGEIYFWPHTEVIAIYYADLGQTVPDPGLIRLGTVDTGLDNLAHAGRRFTLTIEAAATSR
jgi:hypothetical protein